MTCHYFFGGGPGGKDKYKDPLSALLLCASVFFPKLAFLMDGALPYLVSLTRGMGRVPTGVLDTHLPTLPLAVIR